MWQAVLAVIKMLQANQQNNRANAATGAASDSAMMAARQKKSAGGGETAGPYTQPQSQLQSAAQPVLNNLMANNQKTSPMMNSSYPMSGMFDNSDFLKKLLEQYPQPQ